MDLLCRACQAHWDAFFTTVHVGKGVVCQGHADFGFRASVGGWEWESGNPLGYPVFFVWFGVVVCG
ncbi:MAG: hypothetical protein J6A01_04135 [Proteobacteria bacterium]|nr:hypothetical protein [Pseudomonadota bacterium]